MLKRRKQRHMIELLHLAMTLGPGKQSPLDLNNNFTGIEIGVEQGSLARMMVGMFKNCTWHGVDPWTEYGAVEYKSYDMEYAQSRWNQMWSELHRELRKEIEERRLVLHRTTSDDGVIIFDNASVDLVVVDGLHTALQTERDIRNYWPKLRKGGRMCGHDIDNEVTPGVRRAVEACRRPFEVRTGYLWVMDAKEADDAQL